MKVHWRVLAVVVALAATTGCADAGTQRGTTLDLGQGTSTASACWPANPGVGVMFGDPVIRHSATGPVTITDVSLVEAGDLELREAVLVPVVPGEDDLVGMLYTTDLEDVPSGWEDRVDAIGAVCAPVRIGTSCSSWAVCRQGYRIGDGHAHYVPR